jgi:tetratricopeptide (TPR) repeat protein
MRLLVASLLVGLSVTPPAAAQCPVAPDVTAALQELFADARAAPDYRAGQAISARMWDLWLQAPDESAQEILDNGMRRRDAYDFLGALQEFDRLVSYCPEFAEGYNQRAYIHFLRERFPEALADLDIALRLQPDHVAAQSGRALTLLKLNRIAEARAQLLRAIESNPWLNEAVLLAPGAPLGPKGEDI